MPHHNPGAVPEWLHTNGHLMLAIRPGWGHDHKMRELRSLGYPYGTIPHLLLYWMSTEVLQTGSRRITSDTDAIHTMFALATGDLSEDAFADWLRQHTVPHKRAP